MQEKRGEFFVDKAKRWSMQHPTLTFELRIAFLRPFSADSVAASPASSAAVASRLKNVPGPCQLEERPSSSSEIAAELAPVANAECITIEPLDLRLVVGEEPLRED